MDDTLPALDFAPWRLSGTVLGPLLNDPAALALLGAAAHEPPYKAPPRAPVLYFKPRNTLAADGAAVEVPAEAGEFELLASLAMVIGRTACAVRAGDAARHIAGWVPLLDLTVPHASLYRPAAPCKARDRSCVIGPRAVPFAACPDPAAVLLEVAVDGEPVHTVRFGAMQRSAARLLEDVSEFMTLHPGDLLMLGTAAGAPRARAGQRVTVQAAGFAALHAALVAEARVAA